MLGLPAELRQKELAEAVELSLNEAEACLEVNDERSDIDLRSVSAARPLGKNSQREP